MSLIPVLRIQKQSNVYCELQNRDQEIGISKTCFSAFLVDPFLDFRSISYGAFQDPLDKNHVAQILPLYYVWVNADVLTITRETSHKKKKKSAG